MKPDSPFSPNPTGTRPGVLVPACFAVVMTLGAACLFAATLKVEGSVLISDPPPKGWGVFASYLPLGLLFGALVGTIQLLLGAKSRIGPQLLVALALSLCAAPFIALIGSTNFLQMADGFRILAGTAIAALTGCVATLFARKQPSTKVGTAAFVAFFGVVLFSALSGGLGTFCAALGLTLLASGLGSKALRWLGALDDGPQGITGWFLSGTLGLGMISLGVFCLDVMHLGAPQILLPLFVAATIWALPEARKRCEGLLPRDYQHQAQGGAIWPWLFAALALIAWTCVLAPELCADALGGRLALPKDWSQEGWLRAYPEIRLSYMSLGGEVLAQLLWPLAGYSSLKAVQFVATIFLVPGAVSLASPKTPGGWLPFAALVCSTSVLAQFGWGYVDMIQAAYLVASAAIAHRWAQSGKPGLLFAGAFLAGCAIAVKLNGLVAVPYLALFLLWRQLSERSGYKKSLAEWLLVASALAISFGGWLLRSWLLCGNPVFPFANNIFKSPLAPQAATAVSFGYSASPSDIALLPWRLCFDSGKLADIGALNPLFCALLPLAFFSFRSAAGRLWLLASAISLIFWYATAQNIRYGLAGFVALTIALSIGGDILFSRLRPWFSRVLLVSLLSLLAAGFALLLLRREAWAWRNTTSGFAFPLAHAIGAESADTYLQRSADYYLLSKVYNADADAKSTLWMLPFDRDHLYFNGRVISHPHGDETVLTELTDLLGEKYHNASPALLFEKLRHHGITHILFREGGSQYCGSNPLGKSPESQWKGLLSPDFLRERCTVLASWKDFRLYRLDMPGVTPPKWETLCSEADSRTLTGQVLQVPQGTLLRFHTAYPDKEAVGDALLVIHWRDRDGKTVAYSHKLIPSAQGGAWHDMLSTVPDGVFSVMLEFKDTAPGIKIDIAWRRPEIDFVKR